MGQIPLLGVGGRGYSAKVLSYSPIAYWPLWEAGGGVAECLVNAAQNGSYTGVTLGQPGIGDGHTCPLFDGVNDFVDIFTATFRDAFDGQEGSLMTWFRVFNVGCWTDAVNRYPHALRADATNQMRSIKFGAAPNRIDALYDAGGVGAAVDVATSTTDWIPMCYTWSLGDNAYKAFLYGSQVGITWTPLGTWAGALSATDTVLGAATTVPEGMWHGYVAHTAVFDRRLLPAQVADLAVV